MEGQWMEMNVTIFKVYYDGKCTNSNSFSTCSVKSYISWKVSILLQFKIYAALVVHRIFLSTLEIIIKMNCVSFLAQSFS